MATDSFTYGDGALGSPWVNNVGSFTVESNAVKSASRSGDSPYEAVAHYGSGSFDADQYSQITIVTKNAQAARTAGVAARCADSGETYYLAWLGNTELDIFRVVSGTATEIGGYIGQTWSDGTKIKLEVEGTGATVTLRVYTDADGNGWVLKKTVNDTDETRILSGRPGISANGVADQHIQDDWGGGDLVAAGLSKPILMKYYRSRRTA